MNRRTSTDRNTRSEPFEVFTRPQRSVPARLAGLLIRCRVEVTAVILALWAWSWLTGHLPEWGAALVLGVPALALAAIPATRRYIHRRVMAVITRHRLRSVFVERRVMNWTGNLPVLLWSRPTPVGERVWVLLRAGIDGADVERNLGHVASGCFARDARISVTRRMTALVLVDVIRRDPLTATSPPARQTGNPQPRPAAPPVLHVVPTQKGA